MQATNASQKSSGFHPQAGPIAVHESTFSRASHFAAILVPVVLSVGSYLAADTSSGWGYRTFIFGLLTFSLMAGVGVLKGIDLMIDEGK